MVIEGKHLKTGAFSVPWCMKKGKGGLCQKRNVHDSVNKLQYFPKNSLDGWKKPHQCCVTLFFESNASLCGNSYKYQPTSVRSNMISYALKHPGVMWEPLSLPWTRSAFGGHITWQAFYWTRKICLSTMKVTNERLKLNLSECICIFLYWRWLALALCESRYWGTGNL